MLRSRYAIAAAVGAALFLVVAGVAAYGALGQDNVPVTYDGYTLLRVRVSAGGMTAEQRASEIQMRLEDLMAAQFADDTSDLVPHGIRVGRQAGEVVIVAGDQLLLTVTREDARVNDTDPVWLARHWRDRVAQAMVIATRTG